MSASISSTPTSAGSATGLDASRPQVQSRRVSLKLGPLGISYATDQVLWTPAAAAVSAAGAVADADAQGTIADSSGATTATATVPGAAENQAQAAQTAQQEVANRVFSQEMLAAWRNQVQERQQTAATYGRTAGTSHGKATGESAEVAESTETQAEATETSSQAQQQIASAPASRVRQAISAYLSCARNYAAVQPMLTAVA